MQRPLVLAAFAILVLGLLGPPASGGDEIPPEERAALARVRAAIEARPPETAAEYRVVFRELGLVGDAALPDLRKLVRRYVDGPGFDDAAAHAFLGDRRFHHPIPEEITFRGHPFLVTVEEANAKEWFGAEEELAWLRAQAALGAMQLHHRRLVEDHRYRAGDQVFANLAMDRLLAKHELHFTWVDPYAIVQIGGPLSREDLDEATRGLHAVYRGLLERYGVPLGLHDLMDPWGGRPDAQPRNRSFEDGAPLTVFLYTDRDAIEEIVWAGSRAPSAARQLAALMSGTGVLHVVETDRVAEAAALQALHWFSRQKTHWRGRPREHDAVADGFGAYLAATIEGPHAEQARLDATRERAQALQDRDRPYPVLPLKKLVSMTSDGEVARNLQSVAVPTALATLLYREQAWALARMLHDHEGGRYREALLGYLDRWLSGETRFGMAEQVFRRVFDLHGDEEWAVLDAAWKRYVQAEILGTAPLDPAPARKLLVVEVGRSRGDGDSPLTVVLLRDPGQDRHRHFPVRVPLPPAPTTADRIQPLLAALETISRQADGERRGVLLRYTRSKLRPADPREVRMVLLALLVSGYEEISFHDAIPPEVRALLAAWNAVGAGPQR